jgi:SAM-dependent methyltransferase
MQNPLPFEQQHYEFRQIWDDDWFPEEDYDRVRKLAELVPHETKTLLDVGCGNGLFLNFLKDEYSGSFSALVGVDRSETALGHVRTEKRCANIDNLPFKELQFDTVTCMEVLEHLPLPIYARSVSEVARVARQSIIVCVPYKQNLKQSLCECPECCTRFSPDLHVRSYDESILRCLFLPHSFRMTGTQCIGKQVVRYDQEYRAHLRSMFHRANNSYPSHAICPVCGFCDEQKLDRDLAARKHARRTASASLGEAPKRSRIRAFIHSILPRRINYRWIAATYVRNGAIDHSSQ